MSALSKLESFLSSKTPEAVGVARIVSSLIFMEHGTQKIFSFPAGKMAGVELFSIFGAAGLLEIVGGLLLLLGLFTRPVAFLLAGQMAVAYWFFHAQSNFFPANNGGDAAILYCFLFLLFVFTGGGTFSVDRRSAAK
jgi:putative oxidoreductase